MKIVVFGATGKTGELSWRYAVDIGHEVTVFGRSVEQRYATESVNKVQGDVLHAEAVSKAARAAILADKPGSGRILASNSVVTKTSPRADLAQFLVGEVITSDHLNQAICVTSE